MKKLLSVLFGLIFILILLVVAAGVAGYFYLHSDAVKTKLEQTISQQTTTPVTIDSLAISMSGITLEGLVIPNETPLTDQFLNTAGFGIELEWLSLLDETPTIEALRITKPAIVMHQSETGGMKLPFKATGDGTGTAETPAETDLDLLLNELEIKSASFKVFDPAGAPLIQVQGMNLTGDVKRVSGDWILGSMLSMDTLKAGSSLTVTEASSSVSMADKQVSLPELKGMFYQGSLAGSSAVDLKQDDPVFSFELKGQDSDMDLMMQSFGKEAGFMQGVLGFSLAGEGTASAPKDLTGTGDFTIAPAIMPKLKAAKLLGNILGVQLIQDGTFKEVKGMFTLHDQLVDFSSLDVISDNVSIALTGTVGFDADLNLTGNVKLEPGATEVFTKLFGSTADQIRSEVREIPLTITGPSSDPQVKVDTVQVGIDTGKSLLNRFLFSRP